MRVDRPLVFRPLYQERVWGGRAIESAFRRVLPPGSIGESWEIVDREVEQSVVARGPFAGRTLRALMRDDAAAIMGPEWNPERPFPILVKWLDCRERLSLQVHPPAAVAAELHGEPKTEHWYIVHAEPHAALMAGLRRGVSRAAFVRGIETGTLESLVHRLPVRSGDALFVPSGRVHAIDAGNLILEIQQNSDTTYRVYDWGRVDSKGQARPLHVEQSMTCIDFDDVEPALTARRQGDATLADCPEFRIRRYERAAGSTIVDADGTEPRILSVVSGEVSVTDGEGADRYLAGDNLLLPAAAICTAHAASAATVLITDRFGS